MTNPSKAKGTNYETAIVDYLREHFPSVQRHAQHGKLDLGDINGIPQCAVEAKNCQRLELAGWVDEANTEANNAGLRYGVVIHKRRGTNVARSYVTMELEDWASAWAHYQLLRRQISRLGMAAYDETTGAGT